MHALYYPITLMPHSFTIPTNLYTNPKLANNFCKINTETEHVKCAVTSMDYIYYNIHIITHTILYNKKFVIKIEVRDHNKK